MDKSQAIHSFWNRFLPAYDQNTVKEGLTMPYITYEVATSPQDEVMLSASLWYKGRSWEDISKKSDEISKAIGIGGALLKTDKGYVWFKRGTPFAQRMGDEDDSVRRIVLNIVAEYLEED